MTVYEEVDQLFEDQKPEEAYELVKKALVENKDDIELLWRFAAACYKYGCKLTKQEQAKKKELYMEGREASVTAYKLNDGHFKVLKWAAIVSGELSDMLGTKERIEEGYKFKEYLDKALRIDSTESSLYHMRGRFAYSVANLSWFERKAAAAFFAEPPTATIEEALKDFEECDKIENGAWLENNVYLAKCYIQTGNKDSAVKYLKLAVDMETTDESQKEAQAEAKKLLEKHGK
uniref:TPR_REGION domain-containing protein n=1 Tax=Steinernema glaseri TaxID=37863 RepID=A0A1I7Y346_9BILA